MLSILKPIKWKLRTTRLINHIIYMSFHTQSICPWKRLKKWKLSQKVSLWEEPSPEFPIQNKLDRWRREALHLTKIMKFHSFPNHKSFELFVLYESHRILISAINYNYFQKFRMTFMKPTHFCTYFYCYSQSFRVFFY